MQTFLKAVTIMKNTEKLLALLITTEDYISGQAIAEQLCISRQAVWKAITSLREQGYEIDSVTRRGYKLAAMPKHLNAPSLQTKLRTSVLGKNLVLLDEVKSTNDHLKMLGAQDCPNGTVVAARLQTAGKGRMGRVWQAKRDSSITFSVLLRPRMTPHEVGAVTPLAGLAVCKALRDYTGLDCKIKWPNDIIVGKKKLVGILTEMSAEFDAVEYLIIGTGINVDQAVFPEEIAYKATSLLLETGRHYDKNDLLACVLQYMEQTFAENGFSFSAAAHSEYSDLCATIGRSVTFKRGSRRINGMAAGVSQNGELKVMLSDGSVCTVNSGEVTIQGIY